MFTFGDIRAITPDEVRRMQAEIARIDLLIKNRELELIATTTNPLNYILETQRDAMNRAQMQVAQSKRILDQLRATLNSTVESGDTAKLAQWFALARTIGDGSDSAVWREQTNYSSTGNMVATVASDTAKDVGKLGLNVGMLIAVGVGVVLAIKLTK